MMVATADVPLGGDASATKIEGDYDTPLKVKLAALPGAAFNWSPTPTARSASPFDAEKSAAVSPALEGLPDINARLQASMLSKDEQQRKLNGCGDRGAVTGPLKVQPGATDCSWRGGKNGGGGGSSAVHPMLVLTPGSKAHSTPTPDGLERGGTFGLSGSSSSGSSDSTSSTSSSPGSSPSSSRSRNSVCAAVLPRASPLVSETRPSLSGVPVDQRPALPPPNRGRGAETLRAITQAQAALALRASSAWRNNNDAETSSAVSSVPTESTEVVSRITAAAAAAASADRSERLSALHLRGMLRSMSSNPRDRSASKGFRVGPKKRPLDTQGREGATIDPAFCCETPEAAARRPAPFSTPGSAHSAARTWDTFPPAKDSFYHSNTARRNSSPGLARGRRTPEAEVKEEGSETGSLATYSEAVAAGAGAGAAVAVVAPAGVALAKADAEGLTKAAVKEGLVLPCGPSDEEKVLYHSTGRLAMVGFGFIGFCTIFCGMLLFTISSPHFYWYAVPTFFTLVNMCCHYIGVAIWGRDFDEEAHEEIARKSALEGYMPTVDVFLPVCNEPLVLLANTWNHVLDLDYPFFAVHVLDDGANDEVMALAEEYGFRYIRRDNRPELKKAGNLRHAFAQTVGEITAVFDADFCPRPDFLRETLPYFLDRSIGIVQTPQFFRRTEEQTWVEQGAGASQEAFYRMIQMNLDRFNAAVCVGSCALYRREAVEPFGGVAPIEHSEDMYTGYKMTELGYKIKYVPLNLAMGICPDEPRSLFLQQYRWCMGTSTLVLQKEFWRSDISKMHKLCFVNGMFYYLQTALFVFLAPLPVMLLIWMKASDVLWYYFGFLIPGLIFTMIIIPTWSKQDSISQTMAVQRVKILQSYAHLYAIKDRLLGTVATWVPSGGGASKSSSSAYESAVRVLVVWNAVSTVLIVGGSIWRVTAYPWYHFVIPTALSLCSCAVSLSALWV